MDYRPLTCCFTGHRISKLPWRGNEADERCIALKVRIYQAVEEAYSQGYSQFICGMALGCDMFFAEAVLLLKRDHPEVRLIAAVPFPGQPNHWESSLRQRYYGLLRQCDEVVTVCPSYTRDCMMIRNRYMVNNASLVIACFDGTPGGTMNTVLYAKRQSVPLVMVPIE